MSDDDRVGRRHEMMEGGARRKPAEATAAPPTRSAEACRAGPAIGDAAPDFTLTQNRRRTGRSRIAEAAASSSWSSAPTPPRPSATASPALEKLTQRVRHPRDVLRRLLAQSTPDRRMGSRRETRRTASASSRRAASTLAANPPPQAAREKLKITDADPARHRSATTRRSPTAPASTAPYVIDRDGKIAAQAAVVRAAGAPPRSSTPPSPPNRHEARRAVIPSPA